MKMQAVWTNTIINHFKTACYLFQARWSWRGFNLTVNLAVLDILVGFHIHLS